jgi:acyl-CoA synthetase (AMP-forming)/AMP-acid ligase II
MVAARDPRERLFTWVDDEGRDAASLDAGTLLERAATIAAHLLGPAGLRPGDRALLIYPPSLAFIEAFIGCLYAGVMPVPCYPPDPRRAEDVARIGTVAAEAGARVALTETRFQWARRLGRVASLVTREQPKWPDLDWRTTDDLRSTGARPPMHQHRPEDIAFLQYTSGSTSAPRGVALTFGNLEHQLDLNKRLLFRDPPCRGVFWVPQYHDLGLVSGILSAVHGNCAFHVMSPLTFLARPSLWAEVMTRVKATHTAAPNFGYGLLLRKTTPEQRQRYDLSHLRVLMSAGEPIHPETVSGFFDAFAASGLKRDAWCPAYGLAEHTVGVTIGGKVQLRADRLALEGPGLFRAAAEGAKGGAVATLVGCGKPEGDVQVRIVDPQARTALPAGRVGEIWVDSPSKAPSYYHRPEETAELLQAKLEGDAENRGWLRTGDLGLLVDGELFVTGRLKDLVIVGGRNLAAVDLESAARTASPDLRPGGLAAFAVPDGRGETEAVGFLAEARDAKLDERRARALAEAVRGAVMSALRVPVRTVVVGRPGVIPKTTSGKLRRRACREALLSGELARKSEFGFRFDFDGAPPEPLATLPTAPALKELVAGLKALPPAERVDALVAAMQLEVAQLLALPDPQAVDVDGPPSSVGFDSVSLVELADRLGEAAGAPLPVMELAKLPTLRAAARYVVTEMLHLEAP